MNKSMKRISAILTILTIIIVRITLADSYIFNSEVEKKDNLRAAKGFYNALTKKQATLSNVLESLQLTNNNISTVLEVGMALGVLSYTNELTNQNEMAQLVLKRYNNTSNRRIRIKASRALLNLDKEKGIEFSKQIINDTNYELSDRLTQASILVRLGIYEGYDLIEQGLNSDNKSAQMCAEGLVLAYTEHDGEKDVKGNKIDILEILNSSTNAFNHPELMKNMSNDVVRARAQRSQK